MPAIACSKFFDCFFISDLHDCFEGGLPAFYALMRDDLQTKRKGRVQRTSMEEKGNPHRRLFVMRVKSLLPFAVIQYLL